MGFVVFSGVWLRVILKQFMYVGTCINFDFFRFASSFEGPSFDLLGPPGAAHAVK